MKQPAGRPRHRLPLKADPELAAWLEQHGELDHLEELQGVARRGPLLAQRHEQDQPLLIERSMAEGISTRAAARKRRRAHR